MKTSLFADICCPHKRGIDADLLESVLMLAVQLAREGREGHKVGTIFVVGDSDRVMELSRPLILDPLFGHPPETKHIDLHDVRETVKELSQLDGAFVISGEGTVISAARYIDVSTQGVTIPLGYGSRHMAGASITKVTAAVAVVVSESAVVRVFDDGELISEILPELWLIRQHHESIFGPNTRVAQDENILVETRATAAAG